ncbi:hypothetical protein ACIGCH_13950 [Pseudomonas helleri]|uniref:Uncharacterized protein n=1 Tax=Pseudomonas helleri TaxID=1608996 RepID=A0A6A7YXC2_9PSED|nr:hypothetical protein [Pseudomonas helleri]MQT25239.1 hypothetical protein [Pseudomonas helleri]MQT79949.1 hypothetical protein [Pseudomonas helleri]MQU16462.1 hypothetical protein [Pseudomonas helleri]MQU26707.1 hypothetical protein [Pseudomonas helleri]
MKKVDNHIFDTHFTLKSSPKVVERARDFLNEQLQAYAIDCQSLHINTVKDIVELRVVFSQTLLDLGMDTLEWGKVQSFDDWLTGVFSNDWTFDDRYRVKSPSIKQVESIMSDLLDAAKYEWLE